MFSVGIIGPESTGKSTLAKELAEQFHGIYVPEYAREYIESKVESQKSKAEREKAKEVTREELCEIARHQIEEIEAVRIQNSEFSFFDTELIVTKVWFEYAFGRVPEWLEEAILRYPMNMYLLTAPDIPWIPDPTRYNGSDAMRQELFERYESEIQALDIPYFIITHKN